MAKGSNFKDHLDVELKDSDFAASYLAMALEDGDETFIAEALADVVKAHGMSAMSTETGIARQALYKMLSSEGNPSFKNVSKLLSAMNLELTVRPRAS